MVTELASNLFNRFVRFPLVSVADLLEIWSFIPPFRSRLINLSIACTDNTAVWVQFICQIKEHIVAKSLSNRNKRTCCC